jgi:phosphatidylserine/phosphatidylglycerophosphate/cardiolipin synthase-like enzyme
MAALPYVSTSAGGLTVAAYPGDNAVMLAFSLEEAALRQRAGLAGFAVVRTPRGRAPVALSNRLSFTSKVTATSGHGWTPTVDAPLQKFRWIDVPPEGFGDRISYTVTARHFASPGSNALVDGASVTLAVDPVDRRGWRFLVNFTRGYLASQAYADKFHNAPIRPAGKKTIDFDAKPFEAQWIWLGADARKALYDFLDECLTDAQAKVDVFAYDLDEPRVIDALCRLGRQSRLRAVLDDAPLHAKPDKQGNFPIEVDARKAIAAAAGDRNVIAGHFGRFAHDKILIKRGADGKATKVLTGSANFSVRGFYVQANSVIVIDDAAVAQRYADAFQAAFDAKVQKAGFEKWSDASPWYRVPAGAGLPKFGVSFAPHKDAGTSLAPVAQAIQAANSSVLFAVMDIAAGGGPVLDELRGIAAKPTVFSYGTVQSAAGLQLQKPDGALGDVAGFDFLKQSVPPPFREEWGGGPGQTIHHKFVVVDFNGDSPSVYCGSSNLASGGETQNGDNLLAIDDAAIAGLYAVEAVRLFDHYHFRDVASKATVAKPLALQGQGATPAWWAPYYDPKSIKLRDRCLFARVPLPANVKTVKAAWTGAAPAKVAKKKPTKAAKTKATSAKRKTKGTRRKSARV